MLGGDASRHARAKELVRGSRVNGPVAQWIRHRLIHRPTEPGIAGSSPAGVNCIGKPAKKKPQVRVKCGKSGPMRARTADLTVISRML